MNTVNRGYGARGYGGRLQQRVQAGIQRAGGYAQEHPLRALVGALSATVLVLGLGAGAGWAMTVAATSALDIEQTTIHVIRAADPSIVQVQASNDRLQRGVGSGEILTTSGYIVTNDHVVRGFSSFAVLLATDRRFPRRWSVRRRKRTWQS
jgi:S1-C subfamily serine protease